MILFWAQIVADVEAYPYSSSLGHGDHFGQSYEENQCEIRNVPTAVDRTVSSTKILGLFVTKVPFNIWRD